MILYLEAIALRVRLDRQVVSVPVLGTLGVRADGQKVVLELETLTSESTTAWCGFVESLIARGLPRPQLCVIDGHPGVCAAVETSWAGLDGPRCVVHKLRNLGRQAPRHAREARTADSHRLTVPSPACWRDRPPAPLWPSGRHACPRWSPACAKPGTNGSRSLASRPVGGSVCAAPTPSSGCMKNSAAG